VNPNAPGLYHISIHSERLPVLGIGLELGSVLELAQCSINMVL